MVTSDDTKESEHRGSNVENPNRRNLLAGALGVGVAALASAPLSADEDKKSNKEFAGRTAFVTGGARGIGLACAQSLAKAGANVALYDVADQLDSVNYPLATNEDLANAKEAIEAHGVRCIAIKGDVRDGRKQRSVMQEIAKDFGGLDFVIANAGITQIGPIELFSDDDISTVLEINLAGAIKTVQGAVPIMKEQQRGRIILMSSVTGRSGSASFPIYSASKWGMIGVAKSTALHLGNANVTCNAVCPTLVKTRLLDNDYILSSLARGMGIDGKLDFDDFDKAARDRHILPVGFFDPDVVADTVKFLCSDAASMISGDVFDIAAGANAQFPA
ncbi:MAG: SDR family NAD(P)-dependent oxidoreductase [Pseudomonadota bacterium]